MMIDETIRQQLDTYLELLENDIYIRKSVKDDNVSKEVTELIDEIQSMSTKIHVEETALERTPCFTVDRMDDRTGVEFAGVPLGHEFSSLVLALLQVSGRPPKVEQETIDAIRAIDTEMHFETYVSLSCHNCPDVVQALNLMSILNPHISHTMIEGSAFQDEVKKRDILAVPAIYLNGDYFDSGRLSIDDLLIKLGQSREDTKLDKGLFDVLVIGAGPAGCSAAIYSARKGLKTALVAERFGGQVLDTMSIENLISVPSTEGPKLAKHLEEHVNKYDVEVVRSKRVTTCHTEKESINVVLESNAILKSKTVIIATGAKWRELGVPGEKEFKNKGVAYCPHCDGPLYQGKSVAVIGGGNSGIEAAIDLANIAKQVTVLEFLPELKADQVLQDKMNSLSNVSVLKNVEVIEVKGNQKVDGLLYRNRTTNEEGRLDLDGVFVQIGLVPNTDWLGQLVERNNFGEIVVDKKGTTSVKGIFAAGDCTDSAYKQIIIAMGSGAVASLSAFDYLIRNQ